MNLLHITFDQSVEDDIVNTINSYPEDYFYGSRSQNRVVYGMYRFWNDLLYKMYKKHEKFKKVCTYQNPCFACQSLRIYSWHLINIHRKQLYSPNNWNYYGQSWFNPFILTNKRGAIDKHIISQIEYLLGAKYPPYFIEFIEANPQEQLIEINIGTTKFRLMALYPKYPKYDWADVLQTASRTIENINTNGEYDGSAILPFAVSVKSWAQHLCFKANKNGVSDGRVYLAKDGFFQIANSFQDLIKLPNNLTEIFSNSIANGVLLHENHSLLADLLNITFHFPYRELETLERNIKITSTEATIPKIVDVQYHVNFIQNRVNDEVIFRQEKLILDIIIQTKTRRIFGIYPFSLNRKAVDQLDEYFSSSREDIVLVYADRFHQKPKTGREYFQRYLLLSEVLKDIVNEFSKTEDIYSEGLYELLKETPILKLTQKSFTEVTYKSY